MTVHISTVDFSVRKCRAQSPETCPFKPEDLPKFVQQEGGAPTHYSTFEEAARVSEQILHAQYEMSALTRVRMYDPILNDDGQIDRYQRLDDGFVDRTNEEFKIGREITKEIKSGRPGKHAKRIAKQFGIKDVLIDGQRKERALGVASLNGVPIDFQEKMGGALNVVPLEPKPFSPKVLQIKPNTDQDIAAKILRGDYSGLPEASDIENYLKTSGNPRGFTIDKVSLSNGTYGISLSAPNGKETLEIDLFVDNVVPGRAMRDFRISYREEDKLSLNIPGNFSTMQQAMEAFDARDQKANTLWKRLFNRD